MRFRNRRGGKLEPAESPRRRSCICLHAETAHHPDGDRLCRAQVADPPRKQKPCKCTGFAVFGK